MNKPLAIVLAFIGAIALVLGGLLWLDHLTTPEEGSAQTDDGTWYEIRTPPDSPPGLRCWVWRDGAFDSTYGGPVCIGATPERPI